NCKHRLREGARERHRQSEPNRGKDDKAEIMHKRMEFWLHGFLLYGFWLHRFRLWIPASDVMECKLADRKERIERLNTVHQGISRVYPDYIQTVSRLYPECIRLYQTVSIIH